jgi:hypothetical protein
LPRAQEAPPGDALNGKRLYLTDGCFTCHAFTGPAPSLAKTEMPFARISASTIFGTLTRAREARADSRSRFHFLVSAARTGPTAPRSDGAGRADCAAGAAAAAELRRHRRWPPVPPRRRRGLRRVLALDFQAGFPAGAVVLFIHWRWQPTGAGDLAIIANKATANTSGLLNFV